MSSNANDLYDVYHNAIDWTDNGSVNDPVALESLSKALAENDGQVFYRYYLDLDNIADEVNPPNEEMHNEAWKWLQKSFDLGYIEAYGVMARAYRTGREGGYPIDADIDKAVEYALKYAQEGEGFDDGDPANPIPRETGILSDDEIEWFEKLEAVSPNPFREFCLGRYYWDIEIEKRLPRTERERLALSYYEKAAAGDDPNAKYFLGRLLAVTQNKERAADAIRFLNGVAEDRTTTPVRVARAREYQLKIYSTIDSGCFDIEKAFDVALELFDFCNDPADEYAALELFWHYWLPPHNDTQKFRERWNRNRVINEDFPDETLLDFASNAVKEIGKSITGTWWQKELAEGNATALRVLSSANEYLRAVHQVAIPEKA